MAHLTLEGVANRLDGHNERLEAIEALVKKQEPVRNSPLTRREQVAITRIFEFDFDSDWNSGDVSLLSEDAASVAAALSQFAGAKQPDESKPVILNWETLRDLPPDLAEAVEQCKLAIIRHRADKWNECSQQTFLEVFKALAIMASKEKP